MPPHAGVHGREFDRTTSFASERGSRRASSVSVRELDAALNYRMAKVGAEPATDPDDVHVDSLAPCALSIA